MDGYSFFDKAIDFLVELFKSLSEGYLFFGSTADVVRAVCDIVLIAALCYVALRFVKQSRAWQLIQGLFLSMRLFLSVVFSDFRWSAFFSVNYFTFLLS